MNTDIKMTCHTVNPLFCFIPDHKPPVFTDPLCETEIEVPRYASLDQYLNGSWPTATDNIAVTLMIASYNTHAPIVENTVFDFTAEDEAGNVANCSISVNVSGKLTASHFCLIDRTSTVKHSCKVTTFMFTW